LRDALAREGLALPLASVLRGPSVRALLAEVLPAEPPQTEPVAEAPASREALALVLTFLVAMALVAWVLTA
jgi:hypothetical protein